MLFQTSMTFIFLFNTKDHILKNVLVGSSVLKNILQTHNGNDLGVVVLPLFILWVCACLSPHILFVRTTRREKISHCV